MESKSWTWVGKSQWPRGEWDDEPDKMQWLDKDSGLPCLILRGPSGALCGYVGVAPGHHNYEVEHDNAKDMDGGDLDAHGGLTFSRMCPPKDEVHVHDICHEADDDDRWWLGFDCAHLGDYSPKMDERYRVNDRDESYRNVKYVKEECRRLAAQLVFHVEQKDST